MRAFSCLLTAAQEAAAIGVSIRDVDVSKPFSFADYPLTKKRVADLLATLRMQTEVAIVNGVRSEWTLANNKNNELCNRVFGKNVGKLSQAQYRRYYSTNDKAREAFLERKENGLNLSDRVWRYSNEFKSEIEMGLDLGIRSGLDAPAMARDLKQYLRHPDKLFRRVRDEHGNLHLSKAAAAFHPGRGVYRSSYMNARRLAATETNIAYRTADHERWQKMDFVVGIEIHLSNNHNCKGFKPGTFHDICDELAGRYPKDFKFTGWHPHCRCYATSILKSPEEMAEDTKRILRGERPVEGSENTVEDVPEGFRNWLKDNEERAKTHYSVPYFLKDNMKYVPKELIDAYSSRMPYDTYSEYEAAMKYNKKHSSLTKEQKANVRELNKVMPVVQGKIMNFTEADNERPNPNFRIEGAKEKGYHHNCQTCTMTYELRRRGFDVEAMPNPYIKSYGGREFDKYCGDKGWIGWKDRFLNQDGTKVEYTSALKERYWELDNDFAVAKTKFITNQASETGRYEVYFEWKGSSSAHVFIVERQENGNLLWYDPQSDARGESVKKYVKSMTGNIEILRIDDKIINPKFAGRLIKSTK